MSCTPTNQTAVESGVLVNSGSTTVSCAGFTAPSGSLITNVSFNFLGTFSDSDNSNGTHQLIFNGTTPWGSFGPLATTSGVDVGSTGTQTGLTPGAPGVNSIAAFLVTVTTSGADGLVLPESGQYTVRAVYTYEAEQQSGVPEPSTLALVGGVLVLAGIRKFRS